MTSDPCPNCGAVHDLTKVQPSGILLDALVQWECGCRNSRTLAISRAPAILVKRAMEKNLENVRMEGSI